MTINTHILSTAHLDASLIARAMQQGIELDVVAFIKIEPVRDANLGAELESLGRQTLNVVFTSANAVHAVSEILVAHKPLWTIYCIGHATKEAALKYIDAPAIKGTASDGARLAAAIIDAGVNDVIFFCGDKRLDALPDMLYRHGITVREIVVYNTRQTPEPVAGPYEGVLFFSPSGVNSFFSSNKAWPHTVLFAIGNTTATAIKSKTDNEIVISETPSREHLVDAVIRYFHKQAPAFPGS